LLALVRVQEESDATSLAAASRVYALAGGLAVAGLLVVSFREGAVCIGCIATYALVTAYAAVAFRGLRGVPLPLGAGAVPALMALGIATAALIYPGIRTPESAGAASARALDDALGRGAAPIGNDGGERRSSADPAAADPVDTELVRFVSSLPPQLQQMLADSLQEYRASRAAALPATRAVYGPPSAAIRIDEWTDVRCAHCAELHATLDRLDAALPPGSFSVVPHHFPLDSSCNPAVQRAAPAEPVSCVAAAAQICLEGDARLFEFAGALFAAQRTLTVDQVYALAEPYVDRETLEACVESDDTRRKLAADIQDAVTRGIRGTPLVLVNGRRASPQGPFLYAMALTGGSADHPAFVGLPEPNADPHAGHDH
jgi:serine/threonine-protein kinase